MMRTGRALTDQLVGGAFRESQRADFSAYIRRSASATASPIVMCIEAWAMPTEIVSGWHRSRPLSSVSRLDSRSRHVAAACSSE
jgi:hypothetical protein